jgi:hypothetical protein
MTIASFISRRRRVLLLCAATLLLHYLMIGWVGARIGLPAAEQPPPAASAPIVAQLRPAPPVERSPAPAPAPVPKRKAAPVRERPALVGASTALAEKLAETVVPLPPPEALAEAGAADLVPDVQSAQPAPPPGLRVDVPPASTLALDVARTDADGATWSGEGVISWTNAGGAYAMQVEAGISVIVTRVNLIVTRSEGRVGEHGFEPALATEKRRGRAQTAIHFNREEGNITFSASQAKVPLAIGAQDTATLPLQLAAIARADAAQFDGEVDILVGETRGAAVFRFNAVGREEIDTKMGKLQALHLARPPRPGSYNSRLDVWLAPAHGWYPVRIRNTEASGAVTTYTVNKIVFTGTGS